MLNLEVKYLRNLHTNLAPAQPATTAYHHKDDPRVFDQWVKRWTICIFLTMVFAGGALITWYISQMPY